MLGWVHLDVAVRVISDLGLGFLLFMAGYEIDLRRFDRRVLSLAGRAFAASAALALLVAYGLQLGGQIKDGLLVGITLMATALGILVPILKDAAQTETGFGNLIMVAGSLAELVPVLLLSVFFSASSANPGVELGLLAGFIGLTAAVVVVTQRVSGFRPLREVVRRLESTSSQLGVRLAITFALAFGVVAERFGLATILGAFLARDHRAPDRRVASHPGAVPGQARSDRLRVLDPGVLREHRRRPGHIRVVLQHPGDRSRAGVPRRTAGGTGPSRLRCTRGRLGAPMPGLPVSCKPPP